MSAIGGTFYATAEAVTGINANQLRIVGSVVRHAAGPLKGKIHSYLQETALTGGLLDTLGKTAGSFISGGPASAATQLASSLAGNIQNEIIRRGVNRIEGKVDLLASGME